MNRCLPQDNGEFSFCDYHINLLPILGIKVRLAVLLYFRAHIIESVIPSVRATLTAKRPPNKGYSCDVQVQSRLGYWTRISAQRVSNRADRCLYPFETTSGSASILEDQFLLDSVLHGSRSFIHLTIKADF